MKTMLTMAIAVLNIVSCLAVHAALAQQPGTRRIDLQRHDLSVPEREVIQARAEFDPGAAFPRHSHPGDEIIYVLEGSIEYDVDGRSPATLIAGDVLFIPAGTIHSAKNIGSGMSVELGTYVIEKGKPLVVLGK